MVTRRNSESLGGAEVRAAPASSNFGNGLGEGGHSLLRESVNEFEIPGMCSSRPILKLPAASSSKMFATRSLIATSLDRPLCSVLSATMLSDLISTFVPFGILEFQQRRATNMARVSQVEMWSEIPTSFPKSVCSSEPRASAKNSTMAPLYDQDAPDTPWRGVHCDLSNHRLWVSGEGSAQMCMVFGQESLYPYQR